jgi:type II secretory pathway component PulJ
MIVQYKDYAPTTFDACGLPDRQDWYVAPCSTNRDAEPLQRSNWRVQQTMLAHLETEIHRFGHWACGWVEVLLVAPSDAAKADLAKIADSLADYPVLSEDANERRRLLGIQWP